MPKKKPLTLQQKTVALIKRNPWKVVLGVVVFLRHPPAVSGYSVVTSFFEPVTPALHYWVVERLAPVLLVQNTQATAIDRFLLYSQQRDLAAAQNDPAAKTSDIVKGHIEDLKKQIQDTEFRLNKAGAK